VRAVAALFRLACSAAPAGCTETSMPSKSGAPEVGLQRRAVNPDRCEPLAGVARSCGWPDIAYIRQVCAGCNYTAPACAARRQAFMFGGLSLLRFACFLCATSHSTHGAKGKVASAWAWATGPRATLRGAGAA
jgi:hypothetical protein